LDEDFIEDFKKLPKLQINSDAKREFTLMNKVYDTMMPKFRISVLDKYGENLDYVYIKDCKYFALK